MQKLEPFLDSSKQFQLDFIILCPQTPFNKPFKGNRKQLVCWNRKSGKKALDGGIVFPVWKKFKAKNITCFACVVGYFKCGRVFDIKRSLNNEDFEDSQ